MNKNILTLLLFLPMIYCTFLFCGTTDETLTGSKLDARTSFVYFENGKPVPFAKIEVFEPNDTTTKAIDTLYTDVNGKYSIESLTEGLYNLWYEKDSLFSFYDSIRINDSVDLMDSIILKKAITITGKIRLQTGHNPQTVVVHALGTPKFTNVMPDSSFTITNIPNGEYTFVFITTIKNYTPTFKSQKCKSDSVDNLGTIDMIYTGMPIISNIKTTFNPVSGISYLHWNTGNLSSNQYYTIYRSTNKNTLGNLIYTSVDTIIYDTLFRSISQFQTDSSLNNKYIYYSVGVKNRNGSEGEILLYDSLFAISPKDLYTQVFPGKDHFFQNKEKLNFTWNKLSSATEYEIIVFPKKSLSDTIYHKNVTDTFMTIDSLPSNQYVWLIRSKDSAGWGPWSNKNYFQIGVFKKQIDFSDTRLFYINKSIILAGIKNETAKSYIHLNYIDNFGNISRINQIEIPFQSNINKCAVTNSSVIISVNNIDDTAQYQIIKTDLSGNEHWRKDFFKLNNFDIDSSSQFHLYVSYTDSTISTKSVINCFDNNGISLWNTSIENFPKSYVIARPNNKCKVIANFKILGLDSTGKEEDSALPPYKFSDETRGIYSDDSTFSILMTDFNTQTRSFEFNDENKVTMKSELMIETSSFSHTSSTNVLFLGLYKNYYDPSQMPILKICNYNRSSMKKEEYAILSSESVAPGGIIPFNTNEYLITYKLNNISYLQEISASGNTLR
jgi:hypothetical protein